jgi:MoaA/NifB/PqqE/SkfB family radical SAM enzyme
MCYDDPMGGLGFQWHLTDRCNLRCAHCYQERFDAAAELTIDELRRLADRILAAASGPVTIHLTGGEPLLLPGFDRLLAHLDGFGEAVELHVITNGTVTGAAVLEALAGTERLATIKVSAESADSEINDRVRGPGNLARVERGIALVREATGGPVVTMATLGRHNAAGIERFAAWSRAQGAAGAILERFVPLGRGRAMAGEVLAEEAWAEVAAAVAGIADCDAEADDLRPYRAFWLGFEDDGDVSLAGAGCNLGGGSMALMPDGAVFPCRRFPEPLGNARFEPVEEILGRLARFAAGLGAPARPGCRALERALGPQGG